MLSLGSNKDKNWGYKDLPTLKSKNDYLNISKNLFDNALSTIYSPGWDKYKFAERVLLEEKYVKGSDIPVVRISSVLENVDLHQIVQYFYAPSFEERKQVYKELLAHVVIDKITDNIHVAYSKFKIPVPFISDRDFISLRMVWELEDGSFIICVSSINREDVPFYPKYVRGSSHSYIHCKKVEGRSNCVKVVSVDHINPRGWIPIPIVNFFKGESHQWLVRLQEIYGKKSTNIENN